MLDITMMMNSGSEGENNDKFFASYKVMPNMGVFVSLEDIEVVNTFTSSSDVDGKINTYGIHYSMGIADIQLVSAEGDSDAAAANQIIKHAVFLHLLI